MGRPRAARKQPIVITSDDEDDIVPPPPKRPRKGTLLSAKEGGTKSDLKSSRLRSRRQPSPKPVSSSLPSSIVTSDSTNGKLPQTSQKALAKSSTKSPGKRQVKLGEITSFFNNATQLQGSQRRRTPSPDKPFASTPVEEDIEDIIDDDDDVVVPTKGRASRNTSKTALPVRNNSRNISDHTLRADSEGPPKGSQKFLKSLGSIKSTASQRATQAVEDLRPWNEKYGPTNLEELAVHKRKVTDVRNWLQDVFAGKERKRLLILKGPAGSGKTTTMSLLSKELEIGIQEWKNPSSSSFSSEGFISMTAQFEEFVGRSGTYGSLAFDVTAQRAPNPSPPNVTERQNRLVLVEEFPNTFTRSSSVLQSFRSAVLNFLAANTPSAAAFFHQQPDSNQVITPIVMIISETLLSTSTAAADSFTAHRLLGPEILNHPGVSIIEFNPIAATLMAKALELVVVKEARKSGRRETPGPQVIKRLSELGDVRSTISALEFLCVQGDMDPDAAKDRRWGAKVAFTKPKRGSKDAPLTAMEEESLQMVTQRESMLGIFHAVGKVVHNKRFTPDYNAVQPPNHFPEHRRPKVSEVQVDTVLDELGTDIQTFIAALHENYILSCEGPTSEDTMDCINGSIDALSDADLLTTDRFSMGAGRRTFQGTSADNLRQEEMSFQVSVCGLLFSLPSPVKRIAPPSGLVGRGKSGGSGGAFQMYYPTSLRLWRQKEEIEGLLDLWINRAQHGDLFAPVLNATKPQSAKPGSIETWNKSTPFSKPPSSTPPLGSSKQKDNEEHSTQVLLGSGGSARYEMLLERLPYVSAILRQQRVRVPTVSNTLRDIEKITAFTGVGASTGEEPDDEGSPASPTTRRNLNTKNKTESKEQISAIPGVVEDEVAKLVLSDDDIED